MLKALIMWKVTSHQVCGLYPKWSKAFEPILLQYMKLHSVIILFLLFVWQKVVFCFAFTWLKVNNQHIWVLQEMTSLGFPSIYSESQEINHQEILIQLTNCCYELIQKHQKDLRALEEQETRWEVWVLSQNFEMECFQSSILKNMDPQHLFPCEGHNVHILTSALSYPTPYGLDLLMFLRSVKLQNRQRLL